MRETQGRVTLLWLRACASARTGSKYTCAMASWAVKRSWYSKSAEVEFGIINTTYSMIVSQKLVKEVNGLITDETLVLSVDK